MLRVYKGEVPVEMKKFADMISGMLGPLDTPYGCNREKPTSGGLPDSVLDASHASSSINVGGNFGLESPVRSQQFLVSSTIAHPPMGGGSPDAHGTISTKLNVTWMGRGNTSMGIGELPLNRTSIALESDAVISPPLDGVPTIYANRSGLTGPNVTFSSNPCRDWYSGIPTIKPDTDTTLSWPLANSLGGFLDAIRSTAQGYALPNNVGGIELDAKGYERILDPVTRIGSALFQGPYQNINFEEENTGSWLNGRPTDWAVPGCTRMTTVANRSLQTMCNVGTGFHPLKISFDDRWGYQPMEPTTPVYLTVQRCSLSYGGHNVAVQTSWDEGTGKLTEVFGEVEKTTKFLGQLRAGDYTCLSLDDQQNAPWNYSQVARSGTYL